MNKEEAMKILKDFHDKSALFSVRTALDIIIPELCESEDERIRKAILELVRQSSEVLDKQNQNNMITWLEKQKEYESTDFEYVWNRTDCCAMTSALDKYSEEAIINMCHAWYDKGIELERKSWLEKQGYTKKDVDDAYLKGICNTKHELEKQGEQTNKVEPKFQNGQWIVWQNKCYKVNYNGCGYELIDQNGLSTSLEYGTVDASARFYDVSKDAKDGDVLYSHEHNLLWIYKNKEECHVAINLNYTNSISFGTDIVIPSDICPATKEQRDLLFQKMKEAGYEWSEETHELKKISQRMVSAEAKEALYDKPTDEEMKELLRTEYEKGRADTIADMYVPTQISPEESLGVSSEKYMDIVDTLTQGGQKPAKWSLEDERVITIINNALTESNTPPDDYDKVYDWLESLRQKIGG